MKYVAVGFLNGEVVECCGNDALWMNGCFGVCVFSGRKPTLHIEPRRFTGVLAVVVQEAGIVVRKWEDEVSFAIVQFSSGEF